MPHWCCIGFRVIGDPVELERFTSMMAKTVKSDNRPGAFNGHADIPDPARAAGLIVINHAALHIHRNKATHRGRGNRNDA